VPHPLGRGAQRGATGGARVGPLGLPPALGLVGLPWQGTLGLCLVRHGPAVEDSAWARLYGLATRQRMGPNTSPRANAQKGAPGQSVNAGVGLGPTCWG
jgi:hypothetical protein